MGSSDRTGPTYEAIAAFMEEYFPVYSEYGQEAATAHRMYEYYTPDFVFTGYVGLPEPVVYPSAEAFVRFDVSHPSTYERLTPEEVMIDERRGAVAAIIRFEFIDRATGTVVLEERGISRYTLTLDKEGRIKIKELLFFPQRTAPGVLTGVDVFRGREASRPEPETPQAPQGAPSSQAPANPRSAAHSKELSLEGPGT
jgi:hypothetical protein